jgi:hypothetical protein
MRHALLVSALLLATANAGASCPANGPALKAAKWEVQEDAKRQLLALGMLDCLASPDPEQRDGIGFEAIQWWARNDKLDTATLQAMRTTLLARLGTSDPQGFAQPFAALALAEVARGDRRKPFLSDAERKAMVATATTWLAAVRDYRGYDEKEGWRHGVAHGADLLLQLALNPALDKPDHEAILRAVGTQVNAANGHFYIYGEGERLMAPVFYLARRDLIAPAEWEAFFMRLVKFDGPMMPMKQATLARMHNVKGFLYPLYASLQESKDEAQRARLLPFVTKALKQLD